MNSNSSENRGLVEGYLREKLEKERKSGNASASELSALIEDDHARNTIQTIIQAFELDDDMPDFEDTPVYQALMTQAGGESLYDSIEYQNLSKAGFMKGVDGRDAIDMSAMRVIRDIQNYWQRRFGGSGVAKLLFTGEEGTGKTDASLEEGFVIAPNATEKKVLGVSNVKVDVATTYLDKFEFVDNTGDLDDILEEYKEKEDWEVIVLLDEADQLFGGIGRSQVRGRELGDRVKLFRKYNAHLIMTSQRQVAADLRNRMDLRYKSDVEDKGRIVYAEQVDNEGKPISGSIKYTVENWLETVVEYDTYAVGDWSHDDDGDGSNEEVNQLEEKLEQKEQETNEMLKELYENTDMSLSVIADKVGLRNKQQVRRKIKKVS